MTPGYHRTKRLLDVAVALPVLIVTLPLQAGIAGVVRIVMGRPVLFRQERPGLHGEPFALVKFRTMKGSTERGDLHSTARVTSLGRVLRATSLDELPTLWNVVRGDMSLVGPRPLLMEYVARYSSEEARRHDVRPGITGLAQVAGRNSVSWDERLALDVEYVDSASLRLDLVILGRTIGTVFRRSGIDAGGGLTMSEFRGRESR